MFNPISASEEIKKSYIDYILTTFSISDNFYYGKFKERLNENGAITKGPYLEINDSYKTGENIEELIIDGEITPLFRNLEKNKNESEKEIQIYRSLYIHQVEAIKQLNKGKNIVVTSGTGSGKTETFIIPIINSLLREVEAKTLDNGVRAILIYPMNALANDQMKRLREQLSDLPEITFGVYTGNTDSKYESALAEYKMLFRDENGNSILPIKNELISRDQMQETPPHILITNYAMLEYMLLRPNDDKVFANAKLKFIVLDEAHIYRGATGIETSLLIRRLKARVAKNPVQFIITSATLGGPEVNEDIKRFASNLCDVDFETNGIIRSIPQREKEPDTLLDYPLSIYENILEKKENLDDVFRKYKLDFTKYQNDCEKLYNFALISKPYQILRRILNHPKTVDEIVNEMKGFIEITREEVVNMINVFAQAERNRSSLFKAKYHLFARALEGVYLCLGYKDLFINRKQTLEIGNDCYKVFEASVCDECGRLAIAGDIQKNIFIQVSNTSSDKSRHFLIMNNEVENLIDDEIYEFQENRKNEFILCVKCGTVVSNLRGSKLTCDCGSQYRVYLTEALHSDVTGKGKCPACNAGHFRMFYLGYDAATAVLASELFEQIPGIEIKVSKPKNVVPENSFFKALSNTSISTVVKAKQFLSFSDNRNDAAYFASFLNSSYEEILRRRGMFHVIKKNKSILESEGMSVSGFVSDLADYFFEKKVFISPDSIDQLNNDISKLCKRHAWKTVMNEMVNSRRSTSFTSFGCIKFEFKGNRVIEDGIGKIAYKYSVSPKDIEALFDYYIQDIILYGTFEGEITLTEDEREYIFYSRVPKLLTYSKTSVDKKKNNIYGFLPTQNIKNGTNSKNSRLLRTMQIPQIKEEEAINLLEDYYNNILLNERTGLTKAESDCYFLETDKLIIKAPKQGELYQCNKCRKITAINFMKHCSSMKCDGELIKVDFDKMRIDNHYIDLYTSESMIPLYVREHTAQLSKEQAQKYQNQFIDKKINALSCSTTFEMGVDVGDLETVLMRNIPPSPANYVQRAGRAGRRSKSAAFSLTFAKLSSHDFTFYDKPLDMITGKIKVPHFVIENEKIIYRHIFAVALSSFFAKNIDVYNLNNATVLLNKDGFEIMKEYFLSKPEDLKSLLTKSIPVEVHKQFGISNFGWLEKLISENGYLTIAILDFRNQLEWYKNEIKTCSGNEDYRGASSLQNQLEKFLGGKNEKIDLIEFLVRSNILPKYGFPVDTAELYTVSDYASTKKTVQLSRDLQLAISEYAPGSQVVADSRLYTSRYIRKIPNSANMRDWEVNYIAECKTKECGTMNFRKNEILNDDERCVSCNQFIPKSRWQKTIEPRKGFSISIKESQNAPTKKPEKSYRSDDFYIGDSERKTISSYLYKANEFELEMQSTTNDSLMVITDDDFFTCENCGYSESRRELMSEKNFNPAYPSFKKAHESSTGRKCSGVLMKCKISHTFKTDVVLLKFHSIVSRDYNTMLSVMYSLLEAISSELDIERDDIKGCLHLSRFSGKLIYSIIIYDAVAGGAGHVRRIVSADGLVFKTIIQSALRISSSCDCEPSCYKCLRNYSNQKFHDQIDRKKAESFLSQYIGECEVSEFDLRHYVEQEKAVQENIKNPSDLKFIKGYSLVSYSDWNSVKFMLDDGEKFIEEFTEKHVPVPEYASAEFNVSKDQKVTFILAWVKEKVLLSDQDYPKLSSLGWEIVSVENIDFTSQIIKKLGDN